MKIRGKERFEVPRKVVRLVRTTTAENGVESREEISIRVRALPVGADSQMFELFPEPEKPQDWAKDHRGAVLRDPETKKPIVKDMETPEWRQASRKAQHARLAFVVYNGIDDPSVELPPKPAEGLAEFYAKFFDELVSFGLTMGDMGKLMEEVMNLMNISQDVESAKGE